MTNKHCTEEELQLYAAEQLIPDAGSMQHIKSCVYCKQQIAAYQLIISTIQELPVPAFDFDLSTAVMPELLPVKTKASGYNLYAVMTVVLIAVLVIASLWIFRNNFLTISAGVSSLFLLISLIACVSIIGFKILKLYQQYNLQIKKLNFSE